MRESRKKTCTCATSGAFSRVSFEFGCEHIPTLL
jgi:hypothetical protein